MNAPQPTNAARKIWTRSKVPQLYHHITGAYYARLSIGGKKTWRSLKTESLSVAKIELDELLKNAADLKESGVDVEVGERMTGEDAIQLWKTELENDPEIKPSTRHYWNQIIVYLGKSWPEFFATELRHITKEQCQAWAGRNKSTMSATRFNNAVGAIKDLFSIAIKKGARRKSPAEDLKRMKVRTKDLSLRLPSPQKFHEWVASIREGGGRFSRQCADYVEFLAYIGVRTGEAKWVQWRHCDFKRGEIHVVGDPEQSTKNSEARRVPMNPASRALLERIRLERGIESPTTPVLRVHEAQKAMDRAFAALGMERFTHHDLRHYFATTCIESNVDIQTVAKWLGHKDGGVLAMKTYGHLRNEHSLKAASKVSFAA